MVAENRIRNYIEFVIADQIIMSAENDEDLDYLIYLKNVRKYDDIEDWLFCHFATADLKGLDFETITDDRLYIATVDALCIGMLESFGVDSGSAVVEFEKKYDRGDWER